MTEPIPPGPLYKVVTVDDEAPTTLADFVGPGDLILDYQEGLHSVRGEGVQSQESIRFHQRDEDDAEADARIWHIREEGDGFVAEPDDDDAET